ncbi:MAG: hypothetical protein H0X65_21170 [Gemmatimonadetes bacterium]|nr:hypothetical protein [Gemmatimonadota bacterium]
MGQQLQVPATIDCEWSDILRAAITVGRRNAQAVFAHGQHSVFEANYRAYMVKANLTEDQNAELVRTRAYQDLDPTEKGAVSYFLSMGLVKLLCEHFFGVPWLVHLDNFDRDLDPPLGRGSRPDLIGQDANGEWVVVEVKGRSNDLPTALLGDGKLQCTMVQRVEGRIPLLRIVGGVYFKEHKVQTIFRDPDRKEARPSDLKINRARLLREYYTPLLDAVERGEDTKVEVHADRRYRVARFPSLDFELGVDEDVALAGNQESDTAFLEQAQKAVRPVPSSIAEPRADQIKTAEKPSVQIFRTRSTVSAGVPRSTSLGVDGTLIRLGPTWSAGSLLPAAE